MSVPADAPKNKILLIDFDGTLAQYTWPDPPDMPTPGAGVAMRYLKRKGFYLIIFTARAWRGWAEIGGSDYQRDQIDEVHRWLQKWDIPYDEVTAEKRPALFIIDDRAIVADGHICHYHDDPWIMKWEQWWAKTVLRILYESQEGAYGKEAEWKKDSPV